MKTYIPINSPLYSNAPDVSLDTLGAEAIDVWMTNLDHTTKRPGLKMLWNLESEHPITGLYHWENKNILVITCGEDIYKLELMVDTAPIKLDGDKLEYGVRPTFCTNGQTLVMANGGRMILWDGVGNPEFVGSSVGAPIKVTHVAMVNQHVVCNEVGTGRFHYSGYSLTEGYFDPSTWYALDFATAERRADNILAIHYAWNEILMVGSQSIEFWQYDGFTPFSRMEGVFINHGCIAPHTFQYLEDTWLWLDENRQVRHLVGREAKVVSTPIENILRDIQAIDQTESSIMLVGGRPVYLLRLPEKSFVLVYDLMKGCWYKWSHWDSNKAKYDRWLGRLALYIPNTNQLIVGSRRDSKIYEMSSEFLDDDGDKIRMMRRTGNCKHDTLSQKRCNSIKINMERGTVAKPTGEINPLDMDDEAQLMIRWKDDNSKEWNGELFGSLGRRGDSISPIQFRRLGMYRTRQWEIVVSDNIPVTLVEIEEDIDEMGR